MIYQELSDPEYSIYLEHTENGLVCYEDETPGEVLEKFKAINEENKRIVGKYLIQILKSANK